MARRSREIASAGWYHVFNRGVERRSIFLCDADRWTFLDVLGEQVAEGRLAVHAWALMGNHYHLLVQAPDGRLAEAMRELGRRHSAAFNARHGRDGPLFRGRFQSKRLHTEGYMINVLHYIHANPVRAGVAARTDDYPWSSAYCWSHGCLPSWASTKWAGAFLSGRPTCPLGSIEVDLMRNGGLRGPLDRDFENERVRHRFLEKEILEQAANAQGARSRSWTCVESLEQVLARRVADPVDSGRLRVGLGHGFGGTGLRDIADRQGHSLWRVRRQRSAYCAAVLGDPAVRRLAADVLASAIWRDALPVPG